jgi:hypothetical protein
MSAPDKKKKKKKECRKPVEKRCIFVLQAQLAVILFGKFCKILMFPVITRCTPNIFTY